MAFKWEKLTVKSQEAIQAAASSATENGNPEVLPMHLLAALLEDREGVVLPVLEGAGVRVQDLCVEEDRWAHFQVGAVWDSNWGVKLSKQILPAEFTFRCLAKVRYISETVAGTRWVEV